MGCGGSKKMEPEGRYKASKLFFEEQPYTEDNEPHVDHQVFQFYDEGVNHGDPQNSDPHLKDPVCQQAWLDPACQQLNLQARAFVDFRSIAGGFSIEKTCIKLRDGWLPSLNQVLERYGLLATVDSEIVRMDGGYDQNGEPQTYCKAFLALSFWKEGRPPPPPPPPQPQPQPQLVQHHVVHQPQAYQHQVVQNPAMPVQLPPQVAQGAPAAQILQVGGVHLQIPQVQLAQGGQLPGSHVQVIRIG
mmetsp:Transcript_10929/g.38727  ORF Transcript_10929/g.38727 Transcript_10929/m.38727 type:complete len:245 (+) Transcript_10929:118-852(+)